MARRGLEYQRAAAAFFCIVSRTACGYLYPIFVLSRAQYTRRVILFAQQKAKAKKWANWTSGEKEEKPRREAHGTQVSETINQLSYWSLDPKATNPGTRNL